MPNIWIKQAHVQVFDCDYITFKKAVNMFEHTETSDYIYEGVVEPSYKKSNRADATKPGNNRKNGGEYALSHTYSEMSESAGKCRKIYVDYLTGK